MLARAKNRAKRKGIEFDLTEADLDMSSNRCPIFGTEFVVGHAEDAPSLDRLDPTKGYIPSNVCVISRRANRIKNDATIDELLQIAFWANEQTHGRTI